MDCVLLHQSGVRGRLHRGSVHRVAAFNPLAGGSSRLPGLRSPFSKREQRSKVVGNLVVRAVDDEEADLSDVGGYDTEQGGLLESELFATLLKVAFVGIIAGGIALLFFLAQPVIDNTISAFPGSKG